MLVSRQRARTGSGTRVSLRSGVIVGDLLDGHHDSVDGGSLLRAILEVIVLIIIAIHTDEAGCLLRRLWVQRDTSHAVVLRRLVVYDLLFRDVIGHHIPWLHRCRCLAVAEFVIVDVRRGWSEGWLSSPGLAVAHGADRAKVSVGTIHARLRADVAIVRDEWPRVEVRGRRTPGR